MSKVIRGHVMIHEAVEKFPNGYTVPFKEIDVRGLHKVSAYFGETIGHGCVECEGELMIATCTIWDMTTLDECPYLGIAFGKRTAHPYEALVFVSELAIQPLQTWVSQPRWEVLP